MAASSGSKLNEIFEAALTEYCFPFEPSLPQAVNVLASAHTTSGQKDQGDSYANDGHLERK